MIFTRPPQVGPGGAAAGGGGGFALGPANNIFGAAGSSGSNDLTTVTIATTRTIAEATRDAYDTANQGPPPWIDGYTDLLVSIILYYQSGGDDFVQYQRRVGSAWVNNGPAVVAVKGDQGGPGADGSASDFSAVGAGNIPVIGASPGFSPEASGLTSSAAMIESDRLVRAPQLDLVQAIRQASGIEEVCFANIVRNTQSHPPLQRAEFDQSDRVNQKEWAAAAVVDDVRQSVDTQTLTNPSFDLVVDAGTADGIRISDIQVNFASPATNATLIVTRSGSTVFTHNFGSFAAGVQRLNLMRSPGVAGDPGFVDVMHGDTYSLQVMNASLLGSPTNIPYYTLSFRAWNIVGMAKLSEIPTLRTAAETVTLLETLTGADRLEATAIQNLPSARTDEEIRDVVGATLVQGTGISIAVDDANNTITISATGGSGGTPPPAPADIIYYGLSDSNNPASVLVSTLTEEQNPTNPDTVATGTATAGQYFILLVPQADDITSIFDTVLQQDVTSLFTETDNVRTISSVSYKSYVIGPLNAGVNEEYVINFGSTP